MKINFQELVKNNSKKTIILVEGKNESMQKVATLLTEGKLANVVLLFDKELEIPKNLHADINCIALDTFKHWDVIEKTYSDILIKKGKVVEESDIQSLRRLPMFAAAMEMSKEFSVDCSLGGVEHTSSEILRSAFKVIGAVGGKKASSAKILTRDDYTFVLADISVNINPNSEELASIALNATDFTKRIGLMPKVAFLSFSTNGSAAGEFVDKIRTAKEIFNSKSEIKAIGEVQFDTAIYEDIRLKKNVSDSFEGPANVLIFPDLNAGNISSKIMQRMGNFEGAGPVILGLKKPFNNLSRGAKFEDVYNTALLTLLQVGND